MAQAKLVAKTSLLTQTTAERSLSLSAMAFFRNPISLFSLALLLSLSAAFSPENPTSRRILVLLDDAALKSSHSIFFASLRSRGFDLDFKLADDPKIALQRYGHYLYDGLIVFSPATERKAQLFYMNGRTRSRE